jgi:hypothetical protein
MERRFIGLSTRRYSITGVNNESLYNYTINFSAPIKLFRILEILESLPAGDTQDDLFNLADYYRRNQEPALGDFDIPCEEIVSRGADFEHPTRCGSQRRPNSAFCPICEFKLRNFRLEAVETDPLERFIAQQETAFIQYYCKGRRPIYELPDIVAALRDLKTARGLPNASIVLWDESGTESDPQILAALPTEE